MQMIFPAIEGCQRSQHRVVRRALRGVSASLFTALAAMASRSVG
jgi:hypothetical protein